MHSEIQASGMNRTASTNDHLYNNGQHIPLRVRSMVGVIPLFTSVLLDDSVIGRLSGFRRRMEWFVEHRRDQIRNITFMERGCDWEHGPRRQLLLAIPTREMERLLKVHSG